MGPTSRPQGRGVASAETHLDENDHPRRITALVEIKGGYSAMPRRDATSRGAIKIRLNRPLLLGQA